MPADGPGTADAEGAAAPEVSPDKEAEIAQNLQRVFSELGNQPIPPAMQALIDRMAEEEGASDE